MLLSHDLSIGESYCLNTCSNFVKTTFLRCDDGIFPFPVVETALSADTTVLDDNFEIFSLFALGGFIFETKQTVEGNL